MLLPAKNQNRKYSPLFSSHSKSATKQNKTILMRNYRNDTTKHWHSCFWWWRPCKDHSANVARAVRVKGEEKDVNKTKELFEIRRRRQEEMIEAQLQRTFINPIFLVFISEALWKTSTEAPKKRLLKRSQCGKAWLLWMGSIVVISQLQWKKERWKTEFVIVFTCN